MEDKGIASDAIDSAKRWFTSAESNAGAGNYDTALYSLEMSVEIAFKGLLFALGADAPKSHSIGDLVIKSVRGNGRLPKELTAKIDGFVATFNALLSLRQASGYVFETRYDMRELKAEYRKYARDAEELIAECGKAVSALK